MKPKIEILSYTRANPGWWVLIDGIKRKVKEFAILLDRSNGDRWTDSFCEGYDRKVPDTLKSGYMGLEWVDPDPTPHPGKNSRR